MKTLTIFLLASCFAFAQTREPQQALIRLNGDSVLLNSDLDYFKLNEFIFGWHWGAMKHIAEATHSNMNDMSTEWGYNYYKPTLYNDSVNLFLRSLYQDFDKKYFFT
jgi:hypothetical protein